MVVYEVEVYYVNIIDIRSNQPGNDIDVYLEPLVDDLKLLWATSVDNFDTQFKRNIALKAVLLCTINDFLAYENFSDFVVRDYHACPTNFII